MKNRQYNLVSYEVISKAVTGDTDALFAVQERHKSYIDRLSKGNADMNEQLNAKLLIAILQFRMGCQLPSK